MAKESRSFGSQRANVAHLISTRGLSGEIGDLRSDVEEGFQNFEERAGFPELDFIDGGAPAAAGGDAVLVGRALLQDQTFDTLKLTEGVAELDIWPVKPGDSGISVVVSVGAGSLVVTYNALTKVLFIELAAAGSSDDAVATAINADAAQTDGYLRATSASGGNFTAVQASQDMTGGTGDYDGNTCVVAGKEALPKNTSGTTSVSVWTATQVDVTVPALTPAVAGDICSLRLLSDGTDAGSVSFAAA